MYPGRCRITLLPLLLGLCFVRVPLAQESNANAGTTSATQALSSPPKVKASSDGRLAIGVASIKVTEAVKESVEKAGKTNSLERVVQALDGQFVHQLNNTRKFTVISRSDLDAVMKEQAFASSGNVDESDENAAKAFQIAGAKYLVVATVDDFQDYVEQANYQTLGIKATTRIIRLSAVTKIYDTTSGKLLESANIQINEKDVSRHGPNAVAKSGELSDEKLVSASRSMAEKAANRVIDVIFPAKIVAITGRVVTINRGEGTGIEKDQVWDVFAIGKELVDPDTGAVLGREETQIGKVKINAVRPTFSQADLIEDNGVDKGQIVRPAAE